MKKLRLIKFLSILVLIFALLAGCKSAPIETSKVNEVEQQFSTRIIKHEMGETEIPAEPKRVVDLVGVLDSIVALDLEVIAAQSEMSWAGFHFAPYVLERHEGEITPIEDIYNPSLELVTSLEPDLILLYKNMADMYDDMSKIAPTVVLSFEWGDIRAGLLELGEIFDKEEKAEQVIKEYNQIANEARKKLETVVREDEEVMFLRITNKFYRVYNNFGQVGRLLYDDLGFKIMKDYPAEEWKKLQQLSMEGLFFYNPDRIFLSTDTGTNAEKLLSELEKSNTWKNLKAVKNGHLYDANDFLHYAQGPIGSLMLIEQILEEVIIE